MCTLRPSNNCYNEINDPCGLPRPVSPGGWFRPLAAVEPPPGLLFYVLVYPDQPASITIVTIATIVRHYAPWYGAIYQECC